MIPLVWWLITSSRKRCPWLWMQWWSRAWLHFSWTFACLWRMPTTHCPCSLSSRSYLSSWHLPRVWLQTSQSHLMSPIGAARMRKSNLPSLPMPLVRLLGASTHATCSLHSRSSGHQCHQSLCRQGAYTQIVEGVLAPWSTSQWRLENFWSKERSAKESGRQ